MGITLNEEEKFLSENGLIMERVKKKAERAQRLRLSKKSLKRKLIKAGLFWPRIHMYAKYDYYEDCHIPPLKWDSWTGRRYLKNVSNRRIRRTPLEDITGKSGRYKRFFEYWWEVY